MDESAARFWDNCIEKTKAYLRNPHNDRWYVKHIEYYIKSNEGLRLRDHTGQEITNYLNTAIQKQRLKDWQNKQCQITIVSNISGNCVLTPIILDPDYLQLFNRV